MKTIIIKPLYDNYKVINVGATDLENFVSCAKKYKHVERVESKQMTFGITAHEMLIQYLFNKSDESYNFMTDYYINTCEDDMERKWLTQYLDLAHFNLGPIMLGEKKIVLSFECGMYLLNIRMKIDMLHTDMTLGDIKTSEYGRSEGSENYMLQKEIYTMAFWLSMGVEEGEKKFYYHVFTKHKKKDCELESKLCLIDLTIAREKITRIVKEYVVAYHMDLWLPKKNRYCKGCQLYKTDMCELYNPVLASQQQNESPNQVQD